MLVAPRAPATQGRSRPTLTDMGMDAAASNMLSLLSKHKLKKLIAALDGKSLHVGTMCSGTDVAAMAAKSLANALQQQTKPDATAISIAHRFSVEINKVKRDFILKLAPPDMLFENILHMGETTLKCFKDHQASKAVPSVNMVLTRFVCKDVSHMNRHSHCSLGCIRSASKRTGSTFSGMLNYCAVHRPGIVLLENVKALEDAADGKSGSNADDCIEMLEALGYIVVTVLLSPQDHGVPHRRQRLWFVCLLVSDKTITEEVRRQWQPIMTEVLDTIDELKLQAPLLSSFLLKDDDPELAKWQAKRERKEPDAETEEAEREQDC